ncbi:hypothetical protein KY304_00580 [Candidatus Woesearchaeota archaeon]|nr:hypothetical protein [Candidatus Woesearchaeota archaeon]
MKKTKLFVVFLLAVFLLLLPYFLRLNSDNHIFIGSEPHYHAKVASEISQGRLDKNVLIPEKGYRLNPYHFLLALACFFIPIEFASIFVPILLGLLSVILLYFVLDSVNFKFLRSFFVLIIFVLSPTFVSFFCLSTPRAFITFLIILGFYLFLKKSRYAFIMSAFAFFLLSFFGIFHSIIISLILLVYCLHNKRLLPRFYVILFVFAGSALAVNLPFYIIGGFNFVSYSGILSDTGCIFGFSVFSLLLSAVGLFFVWRYKKKLYKVYLLMIILLFFCFVTKSLFVYANLIVSILAGSAFYVLYVKKWCLKKLRGLALLVVFCGLLFSVISHCIIISRLPPNDELVDCLEWIDVNTDKNSLVFVDIPNIYFADFWSGRSIVSSDYSKLWKYSDLDSTEEFLSIKNIDYILVNNDLIKTNVWDSNGLYFLLNNAKTFKNRYDNGYCNVWKYYNIEDLDG